MINSAQFDFTAGPDITGTWENPRTGEVINIRDTIIEDNQIIGITTDNRQVSYAKLQNFIKSSSPKPNTPPRSQNIKQHRHIVPAKPFIDEVDAENGVQAPAEAEQVLRTPMKSSKPVTPKQNPQVTTSPKMDSAIDTVLMGLKASDKPKISCTVKWDEIPEGIMFLKKYLNIDEQTIIDAIIAKYVDLDQIRNDISSKLREHIEKGLAPENEDKTKRSRGQKKTDE